MPTDGCGSIYVGRVHHRRAAAITVVGSLVVAVACAQPPVRTSLGAHADTVASSGRLIELLSAVPADPDSLGIVTLSDFARARALSNAGDPPADHAALETWYRDHQRAARHWPVGFGGQHAAIAEWRTGFGYSIADVDAAVEAGVPPDEVRVYGGVDPAAIASAVASDPAWADRLASSDERGGTLYDWGDAADIERITESRLFGEAGQLLVDDDLAVRTSGRETMDRVLATLGTDTSLADDPDVVAVVAAMDRLGVYSLLLSDVTISGEEEFFSSDRATDSSRRRWAGFGGSAAMLEPYRLVGVGVAREADTFIGVIVIANHSAQGATHNAEALRSNLESGSSFRTGQLWRDAMSVRTITTDGHLTIAVVEPTTADGPAQAWLQRDSLFWVPYTL